MAVGVPGGDLGDCPTTRPGCYIGALEEGHLVSLRHIAGHHLHRTHRRSGPRSKDHFAHPAATAARCRSSGFGGCPQTGPTEVGRVGEARGVAHDDPHAGTPVTTARELLHPAVVEQR